MLWRRAAPSPVIPPSAPVPDADRLRRSALQASWDRGRWVARRRVALRWLMWISARYLMPAGAMAGIAAWMWLGPLQSGTNPMQHIARWAEQLVSPSSAPAPAAEATVVAQPAAAQLPASVATDAVLAQTHNPEGDMLEPSPSLKFEARWSGSSQSPSVPGSVDGTSTETDLHPALKPENWLHSKEP